MFVFLTPYTIISDDNLRRRIDRRFHWPMITFALLMIPLLVIELWMPNKPVWLEWVGRVGMSLIWLAFFIEFMVKIAIAECRLEYAKRNWLDILIIVLPALRPLRVGAITRTSRLFTLRGAGIKFARLFFTAILGLEATDRLLQRIGLKKSDARRHPDEMTRLQISKELLERRKRDDDWEAWYARHQEHLAELGVELYTSDPPPDASPDTPPDAPPDASPDEPSDSEADRRAVGSRWDAPLRRNFRLLRCESGPDTDGFPRAPRPPRTCLGCVP